MDNVLFWIGIAGLAILAAGHSLAGERMILGPIFKDRGNRVLEHPTSRAVIRVAWHLLSFMWILIAILLVLLGSSPTWNLGVWVVGIGIFLSGFIGMIATKGGIFPWVIFLLTGGAFCLANLAGLG